MFTKIEVIRFLKKTYKKCRKFVTVNLIVLALLFPYVGYLHYKVNYTGRMQTGILMYLKQNASEQSVEKIKNHAVVIQQKISDYTTTGNEYIDQYIITTYMNAKTLAEDGDQACYIMEKVGDDVLESYSLGKIDGNKMWSNSQNNF